MKTIKSLLLILTVVLFSNCSKDYVKESIEESITSASELNNSTFQKTVGSNIIRGYNIRWRNTPDFATTNVESLIDGLNTGIFRYPGGSVTHKWNWQTGQLTEGPGASDVTHLIGDVKILADSTGGKVTFVLDVVHSTIQDQINMMNAANVPVEYIELGNELYAPEYTDVFPTGTAYADTINSWVPTLRATYPNVKIGAVMIGRYVGPSNPRSNKWNTDVYNNITEAVDAHIYHVYISNTINGGAGEDAAGRLSRLNQVFINDSTKETWITEYGDKGQNYNEALVLADALEQPPYNATLLLNHCIIAASGNFSKIEDSGNGTDYIYTPEGLAFVAKYNTPTATTTTLTPTDDAHVRNGSYKNDNFGSYSNMQIKETSDANNKRYTYLKFDVGGVSNIISATLRVTNTGANGDVDVKKVSDDNWSESTINWNGKPAVGAYIDTFHFSGAGTHDMDVTNYITAETQGDGTVSFVLKGSTSNYMTISSKEGGDAPELIIESN